MTISSVKDINFVDLYIGRDFSDIKGLEGSPEKRVRAPEPLWGQIDEIRDRCLGILEAEEEPDFSMVVDDIMFRVTAMRDVESKEVFVLRRSTAEIRGIDQVGLPPHLIERVLDPRARGLILCVGEMAAGKSSTISSMIKARLEKHGGIAVAIEDPPETNLNGEHGPGRCIQVRASRKNGGYREQLIRAMRSGADMMMIGEIREADTAYQVAQAGINGHLIFSTMHAGNIALGIERYISYAKEKAQNAADLVADGLSAIVWQTIETVPNSAGTGVSKRLIAKALVIDEKNGPGIRSKIREGKFPHLVQEADDQARRMMWQGKGDRR